MGSDGDIKSLLEKVLREAEQLREENKQLRDRVSELEDQLLEAQRAAKRQAAPFRRSKKKPKKAHKKSGRKKGHDPAFRAPPDKVDRTVEALLGEGCPQCSGGLDDRRLHEHYVTDIPPILPVTTKFITESAFCPCCEQRWNSTHPELPSFATGSAGVMIGHRAVALAAQMRTEFGASFNKIANFLATAFSLQISASGVLGVLKRAGDSLKPSCEKIVSRLRESSRVCADETSWRLCCESAWAWVFASDNETYYVIDKSRGHGVVKNLLGSDFAGFLQSDCFSAYLPLRYKKAKCLSHLIKDLVAAQELQRGSSEEKFPKSTLKILRDAIELRTKYTELSIKEYQATAWKLEKRLDRLLARKSTSEHNRKLANRIRRYRDEWFPFLYHLEVDATNNLAERQIRPFVICRKLSAGNRSDWGAELHTAIMSVFSTCRQRGLDFVSVVTRALAQPKLAHL